MVACLAVLAWVGAAAQPAASQAVGEAPERLAVFLDCGFCNETFIRQEMAYVDYVRDREVAHVHVLVTSENTGAGGQAHTFDLIGQGPFQGMDYSALAPPPWMISAATRCTVAYQLLHQVRTTALEAGIRVELVGSFT